MTDLGKQDVMKCHEIKGLIRVLTVGFCVLFLSVSAYPGQEIRHLISVTDGPEAGWLETVGGVFYDEVDERVYMTDSSRKRVLSFDSNLRFLGEFSVGEELSWPTSLVRDSRGRFFVAQPSQGEVVVVDIEKRDIGKLDWGSVLSQNRIYPVSLAIGPFDELYVADKANERILVFDVNQRFSREFSVEGARGIKDVKVDSSGRVYVVSTIDGAVHVFDATGRRLSRFGGRGVGKGKFRFPVSLAVDAKGLIYVLDQHKSKVLVFNRRGEFLFDFSKLGWREGRLHYPSYIFINRSGKIFVVDRQNSRVSLFE